MDAPGSPPMGLYSHGTTRVGMDHRCVFCLSGGRGRSCAWYRSTAATPRHRHGDSSRDRCSHGRGVRHVGNVVAGLDAAGVHPARLLASSSPGDQHEPGHLNAGCWHSTVAGSARERDHDQRARAASRDRAARARVSLLLSDGPHRLRLLVRRRFTRGVGQVLDRGTPGGVRVLRRAAMAPHATAACDRRCANAIVRACQARQLARARSSRAFS